MRLVYKTQSCPSLGCLCPGISTTLIAQVVALLIGIVITGPLPAAEVAEVDDPAGAVWQWSDLALRGVKSFHMGAPVAARALAIAHTCMYDAWSAYDANAFATEFGGALRRPATERTRANKERALSFAAYRALVDLMPALQKPLFDPQMRGMGYDPGDRSTDITSPSGIGNVTCAAVLEYRHHDGSNQLGDLAEGSYSDWTAYTSLNRPTGLENRAEATHPEAWQPLSYVDAEGELVAQRFLVPQWERVRPFALPGNYESVVLGGLPKAPEYGSDSYLAQLSELIDMSAKLTDEQKMIAEYWGDGADTEQPVGHWIRLALFVSDRDHHSLDDDVKMLFALSNALLDTSIATWKVKRQFNQVRPITSIRTLFQGQNIEAWGGPGRKRMVIDGANWLPYTRVTDPTPPFPDFVSGHSAFSAAAASILRAWTKSDTFGASVVLPRGSSGIEPGTTPGRDVRLSWQTFSDAAVQAGLSRRLCGIHIRDSDIAGRYLGTQVAAVVWTKATAYFSGTAGVMTKDHLNSYWEQASTTASW